MDTITRLAFLEDSETLLTARVMELEADVESYRALAQVALAHVRTLTLRCDQLTEQNRELRNENIDLRAELRYLRAA